MSDLQHDSEAKNGASASPQSWDTSRLGDARYWMSLGPFEDSLIVFWRSEQARAEQSKVGNGADHAGTGANHAGNGADPAAEPNSAVDCPPTLEDLKEQPLWVFWQNIDVPGRGKTKLPYNSHGEGQAKSNDPGTWNKWAWTARVAKKYNNQIGIMFGTVGEWHLAGIDLDSCRNAKTGEIEPWALDIIKRFNSYTEISPSGTGLKIFFWYRNSDNAKLDKLFGGPNDGNSNHGRQFKEGKGEHPPAIEIYRSNRYFTVTGQLFENYAQLRIVSLEDLRWLIEVAGPALKDASTSDNAKAASGAYKGSNNQGNDNSRSGKAFREAGRLKASGMSYEEVRDALLNHADAEISEWARTKGVGANKKERELHRAYDRANTGMGSLPKGCEFEHFRAYMADHTYFHLPTMTPWPAASVNSRLPWPPMLDAHGQPVLDSNNKPKKQKPNIVLDQTRPVELLIWTPDEPMIVEDRYLRDGSGWQDHEGGRCLNLYTPPTIKHGDPRKAVSWVKLLRKLYHGDARHIIDYMAFKVQNPGKKINHGLLMIGVPGIGKDSSLEPWVRAVGPWNFQNIKPNDLFEQFNPFVRAVVLRISEVHDLGEVSRYQFYERLKDYLAAPPDVISCKDKYIRKVNVVNVMGIVETSNHETDGVYLPADDRRHYVASSKCKLEDFESGYFDKLWAWYESGGFEDIAAYLAQRDISKFNPKAPPRKTPAFWRIVDANRAPEDSELADVIERMGNPKAFTITGLIANTVGNDSLFLWLKDPKNRRHIPHRLKECEYEPLRNPDAKDGYWKIGDKRHAVYARMGLTLKEQLDAAEKLTKPPSFAGNGNKPEGDKSKDSKPKHATYARKCRRPKRPNYDRPVNKAFN
jgi:hypothetical protein